MAKDILQGEEILHQESPEWRHPGGQPAEGLPSTCVKPQEPGPELYIQEQLRFGVAGALWRE